MDEQNSNTSPDSKGELEIKKLKLEIGKLKQPFFFRPEFLGLFIPFLTLFITYLLNKPAIDQALKQREWKIEKENFELALGNMRLLEEQEDLNNEKSATKMEITRLKIRYQRILDSLRRAQGTVIENLESERKAAELSFTTAIGNIRAKPINAAMESLLKDKGRYYDFRKKYLDLIDPSKKNPDWEINVAVVRDSIGSTNKFIDKLKLRLFLLDGLKDELIFNEIKQQIVATTDSIGSEVIDMVYAWTNAIQYERSIEGFARSVRLFLLEHLLKQHRKGRLILHDKTLYNRLLPANFLDAYIVDDIEIKPNIIFAPRFITYFSDIDNYFELVRINLKMVNSSGESGQILDGLGGLLSLNRFLFMRKSYEVIKEDRFSEGNDYFQLRQYLPSEDDGDWYARGWHGYEEFNIPMSIDIAEWEKWKRNYKNIFDVHSETNLDSLFGEIRAYWLVNRQPDN